MKVFQDAAQGQFIPLLKSTCIVALSYRNALGFASLGLHTGPQAIG